MAHTHQPTQSPHPNPLVEALRTDLQSTDLRLAFHLAGSLRATILPTVDRHIQALAAEALAPRFFEELRGALHEARFVEIASLIGGAPAPLLTQTQQDADLRAKADALCARVLTPGHSTDSLCGRTYVTSDAIRDVGVVLQAFVPSPVRDHRTELPESAAAAQQLVQRIQADRESGKPQDGDICGLSHGLQHPRHGLPPTALLELVDAPAVTQLTTTCVALLVPEILYPTQSGRLPSGTALINDSVSRTMVANLEYSAQRDTRCVAELRRHVSLPLGTAIGTLLRRPDEFPRDDTPIQLLQRARQVLFPEEGVREEIYFAIGVLHGAGVLDMPEKSALKVRELPATWSGICSKLRDQRHFVATDLEPVILGSGVDATLRSLLGIQPR